MTAPTATGRRTRHAAPATEDRSIPARLARVHLRGGMIALARAELESLVAEGALDTPALADLAEARWRSGDLSGAGAAAAAHLDEGGREPIAFVIAAEALAARGRTSEARIHAKRLLTVLGPGSADALEALFAGQPRGAIWPDVESAPPADRQEPEPPIEPTDEGGPAAALTDELPDATMIDHGAPAATDEAAAPVPLMETSAAPAASVPAAPAAPAPAGDEIALIEADIVAGELGHVAVHLAIILREEGALAPLVLSLAERALAVDASPLIAARLQVVRGDAFRSMGRELEAADAFARSRRALDRSKGDA